MLQRGRRFSCRRFPESVRQLIQSMYTKENHKQRLILQIRHLHKTLRAGQRGSLPSVARRLTPSSGCPPSVANSRRARRAKAPWSAPLIECASTHSPGSLRTALFLSLRSCSASAIESAVFPTHRPDVVEAPVRQSVVSQQRLIRTTVSVTAASSMTTSSCSSSAT